MKYMINNAPVYYDEHGQGKPILCLHGFTEDSGVMKGCLEPFFKNTPGYRRIYLDMPGMGKTPANDSIKNAGDMLALLKQFISDVIGDESFLLVGNSYGGYMSLGLAVDDDSKIDGIFLFGPCIVADAEGRKLPDVEDEELFVEDGLEDEFADNEDFEDFLDIAVHATREVWNRYEAEILPAYKIVDRDFTGAYRKNGYALSSEPEFSSLQFLKPITVMVGKQDESVGFEDQWDMLKHLPKLTYLCLDGVGHIMQLENPGAFHLLLEDWLKKVM